MSKITNMPDTVECIHTVVMDGTNEVTFVKGKKYKARIGHPYITLINEQGDEHGVGRTNDSDNFFRRHFKVIKEG